MHEIMSNIWIELRIERRGPGIVRRFSRVVNIPRSLLPSSEQHLIVGMIRIQCHNEPSHRIVKQNPANASFTVELKIISVAKKRFILSDRFALVVKDGPATAYPARPSNFSTCLSFNLPLYLSPKTVSV